MKNILLLTDFSNNSINAIHYALKLFSGKSCHFFVLHVENSNTYLSDDLMSTGNQSIYDSLIKTSKSKLEEFTVQLKKEYRHEAYYIEMLIDHDVFIDSIKQVLKAKSIDIIVMGTNGITGAKEIIFGSNTINVIRKIDCPTLVIPKGFKYRKPKEILLPLDTNDALSGNGFVTLVKFIRQFVQRIHLVRLKQNNEESTEAQNDAINLERYLNGIDHEYNIVSDIPIEHIVSSYIQTKPIDLTTLLVQKERFFERFFIGSSTTQISNTLKVPLLVFHT